MRSARVALAAAVLAVAAACGGSDAGDVAIAPTTAPPFPDSAATDTLTLGLTNYAFTGAKVDVTGPNVRFSVANDTTTPHEVRIFDEAGTEVGGIEEFVKGTRALSIVLAPGAYQLRCLVKEGARTHAELGMEADLSVAAEQP